jgi:hypothetical protein
MFLGLSGLARFALAGDHHVPHAEVVQRIVDALLTVATIGSGGPGLAAGALDDPLDGRCELRRVGRVALLQVVVQDDAVLVVDDLRLVTELDRLAELAFGDRTGVRVVQADPAGRPRPGWCRPPAAGSGPPPGGSPPAARSGRSRPGAAGRADAPLRRPSSYYSQRVGLGLSPSQGPPGVAEQLLGVAGSAFGQLRELTGDPLHGGLRLVPALR